MRLNPLDSGPNSAHSNALEGNPGPQYAIAASTKYVSQAVADTSSNTRTLILMVSDLISEVSDMSAKLSRMESKLDTLCSGTDPRQPIHERPPPVPCEMGRIWI